MSRNVRMLLPDTSCQREVLRIGDPTTNLTTKAIIQHYDLSEEENLDEGTGEGGARGVMVIVAGYGHGDTSSNPRPD